MSTDFVAWPTSKQKEVLKNQCSLPYTATYNADERERLLQLFLDEKQGRGNAEVEKIIERARRYNVEASKRSRENTGKSAPSTPSKPPATKAQPSKDGEAENPTQPQQSLKTFKLMPNGARINTNTCMSPSQLLDAGCWGCWAWRWCTYQKRNPKPAEPPRISGRDKDMMDQFRQIHETNLKEGPAPWPEEMNQ